MEILFLQYSKVLVWFQFFKVTPTTPLFDTDTDRGTAAVGLPKATHGPGWLNSA